MRFQLVRYFMVASLGIFALVALALFYFEREQGQIFTEAQGTQADFFRAVQKGYASDQEAAARRELLKIHEAGNFNLARVFSNALWEREFAPFIVRAQKISFEMCRALPDEVDANGKTVPGPAKIDCFKDGGRHLAALPGFLELDARVAALMKKTSIFKIKVFDLRGITVYSSEHRQLGEDRRDNAGWKSARDGKPVSELTHRDSFSTFEGTVEDRDLISSYLPVFQPGGGEIVAVFEVYADVTPFLAQIRQTSANILKVAEANQQALMNDVQLGKDMVDGSSVRVIVIVFVLLAILFANLYLILRRAERIILSQEKDREAAQQQLAQSEKMATLGIMVAGVSHQLNTPLAFSQNNIQMVQQAIREMQAPLNLARMVVGIIKRAPGDRIELNAAKLRASLPQIESGIPDMAMLDRMLNDVLAGIGQMSEMVVHLRDFTRLDRAKTVEADLNKSLHSVIYIAKSVLPEHVVVLEALGKIPLVQCNPSQLNQVFLNLISNASDAMEGRGTITVESRAGDDHVSIAVSDTGSGIPDDVLPHIFDLYFTTKPEGEGTGLGLAMARDIVRAHGGDITVETFVGSGTKFTVTLPVRQA